MNNIPFILTKCFVHLLHSQYYINGSFACLNLNCMLMVIQMKYMFGSFTDIPYYLVVSTCMITIMLLCSSPGWIKTLDQYFHDQTRHILDLMVDKLPQDERWKFVWAEMSYLSMWWDTQPETVREKVRRWVALTLFTHTCISRLTINNPT